MAQDIKTEADIAAYLNIVLEQGDAAELAYAFGVIPMPKAWQILRKKAALRTRE